MSILQKYTVIDRRYGHFGSVARTIGNNNLLIAVCRGKNKAASIVKLNLRAVYGDGAYIFLVNGDCLCFTIGLAILNAVDYRPNIIKRYAVGTKIGYIQALVNKHLLPAMIFPLRVSGVLPR